MDHENNSSFQIDEARKQNLIGKRIAEIRKARKMTQSDVCKALEHYGISIQPAALSRWENGVTEPNAIQFLALYRVFELNPKFRFLEDDIGPLERELSEDEVRNVREFRDYLEENKVFEPVRENIRSFRIPLLIPSDPRSVPEGMAPYTYSHITVRETDLPYGTDFALRVPDNCMTPYMSSGDIIFCSYTNRLVPNDVGVFIYKNILYVRTYYICTEGAFPVVLYASNPRAASLPVDRLSNLTIMARVLL